MDHQNITHRTVMIEFTW